MSISKQLNELESEIEQLRREMIQTADRYGRQSEESIHASQKLDQLINAHLRLQNEKKKIKERK